MIYNILLFLSTIATPTLIYKCKDNWDFVKITVNWHGWLVLTCSGMYTPTFSTYYPDSYLCYLRMLISYMGFECVSLLSILTVACSPCCAAQVRSKRLTFQAARPCWPEVLPDVCRLWPACPTPSPITSGLGPGPLHQAWQHPLRMGVCAAARADDIQTPHPLQQHIWTLLQRRQSKWAWGEESARACVRASGCMHRLAMYDKLEMVWSMLVRACLYTYFCYFLWPFLYIILES